MSNCSKDQEYFYEDACYFTCNTGFNLTGSDTRTCQSDGSWSRNETKCERGQLHTYMHIYTTGMNNQLMSIFNIPTFSNIQFGMFEYLTPAQ